MKKLWNYIDRKNLTIDEKFKIACAIIGFISGFIGFIIWLLVRFWALDTIMWLFCFIGYPVVISFIFTFIYGCRHEFHNGKYFI